MRRLFIPSLILLSLGFFTAGCIKKAAVNSLADQLAEGASKALSSDEDLELVGDALPFALKLMEVLYYQAPDNVALHEALAAGFTQYGMVFVQFPAEQQKYDDFAAYREGVARARKLYLRAGTYALAGMELRHPGFGAALAGDHDEALAMAGADDLGMLYWLGASRLAAISNSRENPELIGELPLAIAIIDRCYDLDPDWNDGAIHELLISLEPSRPMPSLLARGMDPTQSGVDRARAHFERSLELSGGVKASPYISLATATCIKSQDRAQFLELLDQALAVDIEESPADRLANTYAQRKAAFLLDHIDDLFLSEVP